MTTVDYHPNVSHAELRYQLAAYLLAKEKARGNGQIVDSWQQLCVLVDKHLEYATYIGTTRTSVSPIPRVSADVHLAYCADDSDETDAKCHQHLSTLPNSHECDEMGRRPRLHAGTEGMVATSSDCRPLRARSRKLYEALSDLDQSKTLIRVLDLFGIQTEAELDDLMTAATGYLSTVFDDHLIADESGQVLFSANPLPSLVAGDDGQRDLVPAFSSFVDIAALLADGFESKAASTEGALFGTRTEPSVADATAGRSFVTTVRVGEVTLRVFVHPFALGSIGTPATLQAANNGATNNGEVARVMPRQLVGPSVLYLVGITDERQFQNEAIRWRMWWVINATLGVLLVVALVPVLWLWTHGDRVNFRPGLIMLLFGASAAAVIVGVVQARGVVTHHVFGSVFDKTLEVVSEEVVERFDWELSKKIEEMKCRVKLLMMDGGHCPSLDGTELETLKLTELEKKFYCDSDPRIERQELPTLGNVFLIGAQGWQKKCSGRSLTRTQPLNLQSRDYFQRPLQDRLWLRCCDGTAYFLERIDSLVRGDVSNDSCNQDGQQKNAGGCRPRCVRVIKLVVSARTSR